MRKAAMISSYREGTTVRADCSTAVRHRRWPLCVAAVCLCFTGADLPGKDPAEETPVRRELRSGPTTVVVPAAWRPFSAARREFSFEGFKLVVTSRSFSRGDLCYLEILPAAPSIQMVGAGAATAPIATMAAAATATGSDVEHGLQFKGMVDRSVPLHRFAAGWQGMFLVPPETNADATLIWTVKRGGETKRETIVLKIQLTAFPESRSVLPFDSKYADPTKVNQADLAKRLEAERELKARAFSAQSDWSFDDRLSHPRDYHRITSPFYITRLNERYVEKDGKRVFLEPQRSIHRGLDFRGLPGAPVYAIASGVVVLAHDMYYEGNFTVINHGFGIFTGFMHQKRLLVKAGDRVKAGQQIGEVGATGMVTGAHLHVSLWVWGLPGDPLSLLSLPLR